MRPPKNKWIRKVLRPFVLKVKTVKLISVVPEYGRTVSYTFTKPRGYKFTAGQYLHLVAPGEDIDRKTVRHMSIATSPLEEGLLISMDLSSESPYKQKFEELSMGGKVKIFSLSGLFTLADLPAGTPLVFIAGGIGITPIRSLIKDIELRGLDHPWTLVHVASKGFLYEKTLSELEGEQHRIGRSEIESTLDACLQPEKGPAVFISGSESFIESLKSLVVQRGIPESRIRLENFDH
ncbi:FAD-dependent oxidoreductase [Kiritimatiellaeota bacterium B1221]|nr:FAD-dependent oxidoreductase [Kiritimatiellaeota bacterium B1221]